MSDPTPTDDLIVTLDGYIAAYPADIFPDPPEDQRPKDAAAAYVLRRVAVPVWEECRDELLRLADALAEARAEAETWCGRAHPQGLRPELPWEATDELKAKGRHVGLGWDPICVRCGEPWPCTHETNETNEAPDE